MKSMTGFGSGSAVLDTKKVTIELKVVNNRFLEFNARLPKSLTFCEDTIKKTINKLIKRGTVDCFFNYENTSSDTKAITVDFALAEEYVVAAKKLRTEFMLESDFNTTALLRSPEVVKIDLKKDDPEVIAKLAKEATEVALKALDKMRIEEGKSIKTHLTSLVKNIVAELSIVIKRTPEIVAEYRQKIELRIKDILAKVDVDEARLLNEVAFFADKVDVSEEISRLSSHIDQFLKTLDSKEPQGRKLDFLSQEINREINTIGSKSSDLNITNAVIVMKNELEKIKEQIRNVE